VSECNTTPLVFTYSDFVSMFPAFANPIQYTSAALEMQFTLASNYISNVDYGGNLTGAALQSALYLMTAHLQASNDLIAANDGGAPGIVTEATVDKVKVVLVPPPVKDSAWRYWLNQTPYGQSLLALLTVQAVGGWFVPGGVAGGGELGAFRRVGGRFSGRFCG
jgi:hypothetical protein